MPGNGCVDGLNGDHVVIAPPYNVTRDEVDIIVDRTTHVVKAVLG